MTTYSYDAFRVARAQQISGKTSTNKLLCFDPISLAFRMPRARGSAKGSAAHYAFFTPLGLEDTLRCRGVKFSRFNEMTYWHILILAFMIFYGSDR